MPERAQDTSQVHSAYTKPRDFHNVSRAVLRSEQAKRWTKRYRTEVAASSSSLLSTFVAVRTALLRTFRHADASQYPLDSVKTRLQAYASLSFQHVQDLTAPDITSVPSPTASAIHTRPRVFMDSGEVRIRRAEDVLMLILMAQASGRHSSASPSYAPYLSRYTKNQNTRSMTGYTRPRGALPWSLRTRRMPYLPCQL